MNGYTDAHAKATDDLQNVMATLKQMQRNTVLRTQNEFQKSLEHDLAFNVKFFTAILNSSMEATQKVEVLTNTFKDILATLEAYGINLG